MLLALACWAEAAHNLDPGPWFYVRKATWQETVRASREAVIEHSRATASQAKAEAEPQLGPWHVIGPFSKGHARGFDEVFPPEERVDLGADGDGLRWKRRDDLTDGRVHSLTGGAEVATYLYRTITAERPTVVTAYIGSDDGLKVWLGGKLLLSHDVWRICKEDQEKVRLELAPSRNELLLKVHNRIGGYAFTFSLHPKEGLRRAPATIWRYVERDFDDPVAQHEMRWEQADGIWKRDWRPGDLAALARRYAKATRGPAMAARAAALAAKARTPADLQAVRDVYYQAHGLAAVTSRVGAERFASLQASIRHLQATYPDHYRRADGYLATLAELETACRTTLQSLRAGDAEAVDRFQKLTDAVDALARGALVEDHPLLVGKPLLFVRRRQIMGGSHYAYTEAVSWADDRERHFSPPAALCVLPSLRPDAKATVLVDSPQGVIRDPDVHWDGTKVLFAHKKATEDDYHLYEFHVKRRGVRQLTRGDGFADYEGCYLPDGTIAFNSTRCVQTVPCWVTPVSNLYACDSDGRHIRRLSTSQVHDNFPSVLGDGRVLYTRWEYADKGQLWVQGLFAMNPDGTGATAYYGNNSYWPITMIHARAIPGSNRIVCTLCGHHTNQTGEIGVFDVRRGTEEAAGCVRIWPPRKVEAIRRETYTRDLRTRYQYPWPLSQHYFVVSCQPEGRRRFGVYLIDTFGNRVLVHEDPTLHCASPMPLASRPRPPVIPTKVRYAQETGTVYMADVYEGPGLAGVPRGTVKRLRVIEMLFRPFGPRRGLSQRGPAGGTLIMPPMGLGSTWDAKRVVGTAPVYEDGSALFTVPAGTALAFQPLDKNGKAVQWMRSWAVVMPGERISCVGCHEPRGQTPPRRPTLAEARGPVATTPWLVSDRAFSFHEDVQPVLDRACVRCHHQDHPKGVDLRGDKTDAFSLGYEHLRRYVTVPGPQSAPSLIPPRSTGAIASRLVAMLEKGHEEVKLGKDEWDRLITWIDLNVPYYRSYALVRPDGNFGRCVVGDMGPLEKALGPSCRKCHKAGFRWSGGSGYDTKRAVLVNLTHPDESRLLRASLAKEAGGLGLCGPSPFPDTGNLRYRAALAAIEGWARELAVRPREDMPGARPSTAYRTWWAKRQEATAIERASRDALAGRDGGPTTGRPRTP